MEGIVITSNTAGSSSSSSAKGKQAVRTKIIAGAQQVDELALPVLAVYKQKYVSISRALDSAEVKLAKAPSFAVGSLHDLKVKVPVSIDSEVINSLNNTVHATLSDQYVAVLTDKVIELKKAAKDLVPALRRELQDAQQKMLDENTEGATDETVKYWTDLTSRILEHNNHQFAYFVDTFRAKKAMGDTPTMVGQVSDSNIAIDSNDTNNDAMDTIEPSTTKQKKKGQGWRRRQKKQSQKDLLQTKQTTTPSTSKGPKAERQKTPKSVSVNNISSLKYLPMYVWKSLDRGTNFQLTKYCSYHQCQKDWQETKKRIEVGLDRAKTKDVSLFFVNKNVLDISFNVISQHLFNKTIFNHNRFHKSKFGTNKMIEKSFSFLVENNLVVTCADKNMGLTIMDYEWYNYQVNKHLSDRSVYMLKQDGWALNTVDTYGDLFDIIMSVSNEYIRNNGLDRFLNILDPDLEFPAPLFYIIPKLHKNPISSRPITPSYAWVTSDVSKYLADKWSSLVLRCDYILPNSMKLIKEIEELNNNKKLPINASLYTWDIKSMYTNIDLDDICVRIKDMLIYLKVKPEIAEFE
ncbi:15064_t:CDS:1, partial [Cetraspora pellucida]